MKILENLKRVEAAVKASEAAGGDLAERLKNTAIDAIMNGIKSDQWRTYMSLFADNAAQLQRLTTRDPADANFYPQARAYIVTNPICGGITTTATPVNVDEAIDDGLPVNVEANVVGVRPFVIP